MSPGLVLGWAASLAFYLALVPSVTPAEAAVGLVVSLVTVAVAVAAGKAFGTPPRPSGATLRLLLVLPFDVARDVGVLIGFAARLLATRGRASGQFDEIELLASEDGSGRASRAYGALLLSVPPSCYVVDVDVREGSADVVRVHRLGRPHRAEQSVAR
jgi:hypothetical protein